MVSGRYSGFDIMRRTRVFQGVVVVSLLLLTAGLFFFQIAQGDEYVKLASASAYCASPRRAAASST